MSVSAFLAAWFIHLIAAASPGPAILMSARVGMTQGMRTGLFFSIGCGVGALFWALAAYFGLALLFEIAPAFLWGLKLAGGLFLIWLALQMWRHAHDPLPQMADQGSPTGPMQAMRDGVATQLANPKPAVFFGAVFVGTIPKDASVMAISVLMAAIFVNEVVCNVAVARCFSLEAPRRVYERIKPSVDRVFGGLLGLLGIRVALG